ncbi:hypothetical protein [Streptomyces sp. NBC_00470]|uniref:hypothetical protein n=1 Tax=Streptomyces sp. NBC_00470 TaxID=2975753 RepID=UPI0030E5A24B
MTDIVVLGTGNVTAAAANDLLANWITDPDDTEFYFPAKDGWVTPGLMQVHSYVEEAGHAYRVVTTLADGDVLESLSDPVQYLITAATDGDPDGAIYADGYANMVRELKQLVATDEAKVVYIPDTGDENADVYEVLRAAAKAGTEIRDLTNALKEIRFDVPPVEEPVEEPDEPEEAPEEPTQPEPDTEPETADDEPEEDPAEVEADETPLTETVMDLQRCLSVALEATKQIARYLKMEEAADRVMVGAISSVTAAASQENAKTWTREYYDEDQGEWLPYRKAGRAPKHLKMRQAARP